MALLGCSLVSLHFLGDIHQFALYTTCTYDFIPRFATPLCCAIFEQRASISVDSVEADVRERAMRLKEKPKLLYYNKGL